MSGKVAVAQRSFLGRQKKLWISKKIFTELKTNVQTYKKVLL